MVLWTVSSSDRWQIQGDTDRSSLDSMWLWHFSGRLTEVAGWATQSCWTSLGAGAWMKRWESYTSIVPSEMVRQFDQTFTYCIIFVRCFIIFLVLSTHLQSDISALFCLDSPTCLDSLFLQHRFVDSTMPLQNIPMEGGDHKKSHISGCIYAYIYTILYTSTFINLNWWWYHHHVFLRLAPKKKRQWNSKRALMKYDVLWWFIPTKYYIFIP